MGGYILQNQPCVNFQLCPRTNLRCNAAVICNREGMLSPQCWLSVVFFVLSKIAGHPNDPTGI